MSRDTVDTPPGEISPIQDPTPDYEDGRRQCEGVGSRRRGLSSYAARPQGGRENHWPRRRIEDVVESLKFCLPSRAGKNRLSGAGFSVVGGHRFIHYSFVRSPAFGRSGQGENFSLRFRCCFFVAFPPQNFDFTPHSYNSY